jgi:hypothetical protein
MSQATGLLFRPEIAVPVTVTARGEKWSLEELKLIIAGYIEVVPVEFKGHPYLLIVNEDGKRDLRFNGMATVAFQGSLQPYDWIAGNALLVERGTVE